MGSMVKGKDRRGAELGSEFGEGGGLVLDEQVCLERWNQWSWWMVGGAWGEPGWV